MCPYTSTIYLDEHDRPTGWSKRARTVERVCGKCTVCLSSRASERAILLAHEAAVVEFTSVLTLSYNDDHRPPAGAARGGDVSAFIKRLRSSAAIAGLGPFRYAAVMEYAPETGRQHWHVLLFGFWDPGASRVSLVEGGKHPAYKAPMIEGAWGKGNVLTQMCEGSAIFGYVLKHQSSCEVGWLPEGFDKAPIRCSMLLGQVFLERYQDQLLRDGSVVIGGVPMPLPKRYREWLKEHRPGEFAELLVRAQFEASAPERVEARAQPRRVAREAILKARFRSKRRRSD